MSKFATVINCMDGRTQLPVIEWVKNHSGVDYVDTITEAGPVKLLAENSDSTLVNSIKKKVLLSINKHHSKSIAIVAHHDCAGNPVSKKVQLEQLKAALKTIESWDLKAETIGLWLDDKWTVIAQ